MEGNSSAQPPYPDGSMAQMGEFPIVLYRMGLGAVLAKKIAVLTSRGSKTGLLRHAPIGYARDGDMFYTFPEGGEHSDWYQNLQANPDATLQIGSWRFAVQAEMLDTGEEIEEMLAATGPAYPEFADYAAKIAGGDLGSLKVVRFLPTGYPPEGEIPTDLAWVPWLLGGMVVFVLGRVLFGGKKKEQAKSKEAEEAEEPEEPKKARKAKKAKAEKDKKSSKLGLAMKVIKVAPAIVLLVRKFSEHEGEERSTKDWFEMASTAVAVVRQLTV